MEFLDREEESKRLKAELSRKGASFVVVYGRRRLGKSTLLKPGTRALIQSPTPTGSRFLGRLITGVRKGLRSAWTSSRIL